MTRDKEIVQRLQQRVAWLTRMLHEWSASYDAEGRLISLDLGLLSLPSLPSEIGQLSSLDTLSLSYGLLTSLPSEIGQLSNLRKLRLRNNRLTSLPPEIGQLSSLEELDLGTDKSFELQTFGLRNNRLTSLPPEIGQLSSLRELNLENNELTSLPPEIGQLSSLEELDLGGNQLTSLPPEMGQLRILRTLNLRNNPNLRVPPPEVVLQGTPAVLAYLRALLLADETPREKSSTNRKETLPIKVFYCYAHEDKDLRDRIDKHLGVLKRLGQVIGWYDREIQAGTEWEREIEANLSTANIILLLVSADFVASDYCYGVEMKKALELHRTGQARVLPILLRSVDWQDAPFAMLQMLPTGAKPITQWQDQDEALKDVAKGIRNVVSSLRSQKK